MEEEHPARLQVCPDDVGSTGWVLLSLSAGNELLERGFGKGRAVLSALRKTNDCVVVQLQQNAWQLGVPGYEAPVEAVEAPVEAVRVEDNLELATEEQLATEVAVSITKVSSFVQA